MHPPHLCKSARLPPTEAPWCCPFTTHITLLPPQPPAARAVHLQSEALVISAELVPLNLAGEQLRVAHGLAAEVLQERSSRISSRVILAAGAGCAYVHQRVKATSGTYVCQACDEDEGPRRVWPGQLEPDLSYLAETCRHLHRR